MTADRMFRAELPEYKGVGLLSQAESEARINSVQRAVGEYISFSVADTRVMRPPEHVVDAVKRSLDEPANVYPPHAGDLQVRETVANFLKKYKGLDADPRNEIVITPGTQTGIFGVFMSMIDSGDEVVLLDPDYSCFEPPARLVDAKVVPVPLGKHDSGYKFDYDALRERVTKQTKLLVFSNPNNPAGILYSKEDLASIADLANDYDFYVLADELYGRLVYDGAHHSSLAAVPGMDERTITLMGISKTESMQGLRTGFVFARKEIARRMSELVRYSVQRAPYYAQKAMEAVLQEPKEYVAERIRIHQEKRDIIVRGLNRAPGIRCPTPQGTSYVFPDISDLGIGSQEFCERLLRLAGIYVPPGFHFGRNGEGHFRLCFACSNERLAEASTKVSAVSEQLLNR